MCQHYPCVQADIVSGDITYPQCKVVKLTVNELLDAVARLPVSKAPGPDGIRNEILKMAVPWHPHIFLDAMNQCLVEGTFPVKWKIADLVLKPKPGRPLKDPGAYRPLCKLDTMGKLLEKTIVKRLRDHMESISGLTDNQYDFRRGRSIINALRKIKEEMAITNTGAVKKLVGLVTLDVKNAFNSAPWCKILESLAIKKTPDYLMRILKSNLSDRALRVNKGGNTIELTCSVPQGSILGPDLWNILYDSLLRIEMLPTVQLLAFVDDVAVMCTCEIPWQMEEFLETAINKIIEWMSNHGIELALQKTEVVVLSRKQLRNSITLNIGGHRIQSRPSIRYLGVQIDSKMNFSEHAALVSERSTSAVKSISIIMANTKGPKERRRKLIASVVNARLLYGSQVWLNSMSTLAMKKMSALQSRASLRVACTYCTVSFAAAAVVVSFPPTAFACK